MENYGAFPDSGNLSSKVVAVAAGEAHTLALTGEISYTQIRKLGIISIALFLLLFTRHSEFEYGACFLFLNVLWDDLVAGDGRVYSWGKGMFGRLGTGSEADQLFPVEVKFGNSELKFVAVAAGAYHSLALAG